MELREHSYSVLLVSSSEKFNRSLLEMLPESSCRPVTVVTDVTSARQCLTDNTFDLVIINTPLPDDSGTRLALDISDASGSGVMLLAKAEFYPDINARVSPYGVLAISKPTSAAIISQSLSLLCAMRERLRRMEKKTASIEEKIEEIRIVSKAKWLLIDNLKMSEKDAHRFIEKEAMDRCTTRRVVADEIIEKYG